MHSYSIDYNIRGKILLALFIISILLSTLLTSILGDTLSNIGACLKTIEWLTEFTHMLEKLGITFNFIGTPTLFGIIYWIYSNFVWKIPLLIKIHGIPNLNGKWVGTLKSSYNDNTISMEMEVRQTWNKISFCSMFPDTDSKSVSRANPKRKSPPKAA